MEESVKNFIAGTGREAIYAYLDYRLFFGTA